MKLEHTLPTAPLIEVYVAPISRLMGT
jgi:hypothetical protein